MLTHQSPMAVVSRPKAIFLRHVGVLLPNGYVAHCAPGRGEHVSTIEEFAAGYDVTIEKPLPPADHGPTLQRVSAAVHSARPYDLFNNNCEMFANRAIGQEPHSTQIQSALIVLGVVALIVFAASN